MPFNHRVRKIRMAMEEATCSKSFLFGDGPLFEKEGVSNFSKKKKLLGVPYLCRGFMVSNEWYLKYLGR